MRDRIANPNVVDATSTTISMEGKLAGMPTTLGKRVVLARAYRSGLLPSAIGS